MLYFDRKLKDSYTSGVAQKADPEIEAWERKISESQKVLNAKKREMENQKKIVEQ